MTRFVCFCDCLSVFADLKHEELERSETCQTGSNILKSSTAARIKGHFLRSHNQPLSRSLFFPFLLICSDLSTVLLQNDTLPLNLHIFKQLQQLSIPKQPLLNIPSGLMSDHSASDIDTMIKLCKGKYIDIQY